MFHGTLGFETSFSWPAPCPGGRAGLRLTLQLPHPIHQRFGWVQPVTHSDGFTHAVRWEMAAQMKKIRHEIKQIRSGKAFVWIKRWFHHCKRFHKPFHKSHFPTGLKVQSWETANWPCCRWGGGRTIRWCTCSGWSGLPWPAWLVQPRGWPLRRVSGVLGCIAIQKTSAPVTNTVWKFWWLGHFTGVLFNPF